MKKACCCKCKQEIEDHDFYVNSRQGKICSDCLIQAGSVDDDCARLFKPRGPKAPKNASKSIGAALFLPAKKAL